MIVGKYNIICPQGSTLMKTLTWLIDDVPVDLSGYGARMHVRERYSSPDAIVYLSTFGYNPSIFLGGSAGTINILIDAVTTAEFYAKEYVYDLEMVSGSIVKRLIEGKFIVTPEVTR